MSVRSSKVVAFSRHLNAPVSWHHIGLGDSGIAQALLESWLFRREGFLSMRVVVHVPARAEWRALLPLLPPHQPSRPLPVGEVIELGWSIDSLPIELFILRGGVGKTRAAASTQYAICTWQPDLYLVLGTAGAVDPTLQELDLIWATDTLIADFQLGLTNTTTNSLITDHQTRCADDWAACPFPLPVRPGVIATSDGDVTQHNVAWLRATFAATLADWESGAIAFVCAINAIPWLILRGVSDTPTTPTAQQYQHYQHNTPLVMQRLWSLIPSVLTAAPTILKLRSGASAPANNAFQPTG
jgi:adenosylhomocysteine nucleosidase